MLLRKPPVIGQAVDVSRMTRVAVLGEQFGKPFVAQARKLDLSSSSAVESILERADGPEC
ncbi:MAG: hypothetical protein DMG49_25335 [Acidobacteria bacterium]|nr:MAG: hypothetical protein DMG49_25335 [Acidobacteriota bacterium]